MKRKLGDISRELTIVKVKEQVASRKYDTITEMENTLKKERNKAIQERNEIEKVSLIHIIV